MTRRRSVGLHLGAALMLAAPALAQVIPGLPPGTTVIVSSGPTPNGPEPTGTGRIRGRVVDAVTGTPLHDTMLRLTGGGLRTGQSAGTDNEGRFEFENLPAGRFTLMAVKPGYMQLEYGQRRPFESGKPIDLADKQTLEGVDFAIPKGGVIVVRLMDENGEPVENIRVVAQRSRVINGERRLVNLNQNFQGTDDRGEVRMYGLPPGDYYVSALGTQTGPSTSLVSASGKSYIPTFYPGTPSVDAAERVGVQIGKEVAVSFAVVAARRVRVSGIVRRADGSPAPRTSVLLLPRIGSGPISPVQVQADGTFSAPNVTPGEYTVQSSFSSSPTDREQGRVPITVADADVTGVIVTLSKGGTIRGRVSFDTPPPSSVRLQSLQPYFTAVPLPNDAVMFTGTPNVLSDGTFVISNVFDQGFVRLMSIPAGWFIKSVTLGGKDVTDVPIAAEAGGELTGVEVVLTQTRAELTGTVADDKGTPVTDYTIIAFPEDRSLWTAGSRFIATARPDQQGRFALTGMPPGKYLVAAVEYIETGSERDPDVLDRLRGFAKPLTLSDGQAQMVTLALQ